jgi:hypothetical protein
MKAKRWTVELCPSGAATDLRLETQHRGGLTPMAAAPPATSRSLLCAKPHFRVASMPLLLCDIAWLSRSISQSASYRVSRIPARARLSSNEAGRQFGEACANRYDLIWARGHSFSLGRCAIALRFENRSRTLWATILELVAHSIWWKCLFSSRNRDVFQSLSDCPRQRTLRCTTSLELTTSRL